VRFQCSHCEQIVSINNDEKGTVVACGHCQQPDEVPSESFAARVVISDYVIIEKIGHGRMAGVYLAHQMSLDRRVALKLLSKELADDSDLIMDFFKEARAAARLNHPNIVQAYAVDEEDGTYFLAMEHIEGQNLQQMLEDNGPLPFDYSLRIIHQIAEALSFIWNGHKLCHGNIKPENILITKTDIAKLSDLGLSKVNTLRERSANYLSPEKILDSKTDIRADLYALGIIFYEVLAGCRPFESSSNEELRTMQLKQTPPDINRLRTQVPKSYLRILDKLLAKHPDDRYQSPDSLINDIKLARASKSEKKTNKAAIRIQQKNVQKNTNSQKAKKQNTFLMVSLTLNVLFLLTILMIITGKSPVKAINPAPSEPSQMSRYHQLAIDIGQGLISVERASTLLEEVNLFSNQHPESPHLPVLMQWKTSLEEIIINSRRLELHKKRQAEEEEKERLQNIIEGKDQQKKNRKPQQNENLEK
jgi:serine/threonine protein kinase